MYSHSTRGSTRCSRERNSRLALNSSQYGGHGRALAMFPGSCVPRGCLLKLSISCLRGRISLPTFPGCAARFAREGGARICWQFLCLEYGGGAGPSHVPPRRTTQGAPGTGQDARARRPATLPTYLRRRRSLAARRYGYPVAGWSWQPVGSGLGWTSKRASASQGAQSMYLFMLWPPRSRLSRIYISGFEGRNLSSGSLIWSG